MRGFSGWLALAFLLAMGGSALALFGSSQMMMGTSAPPSSGGGGGGGGTIACDIGPPYNGSVPAGAAKAGMTHCAANYDFTSTANFTYNGNTYNMSQINTWLDCAITGGNPPLLYNVGYYPGPTPCSRNVITNDSIDNKNTLQSTYTPADGCTTSPEPSSCQEATWISTSGGGSFAGGMSAFNFSWPQNVYTDISYRFDTATNTVTGMNSNDYMSYFNVWCCGQQNRVEYDAADLQFDIGGSIDWSTSGSPIYHSSGYCILGPVSFTNPCVDSGNNGYPPGSGYSPTQYALIGMLVETDGSTAAGSCAYFNNQVVPQTCKSFAINNGLSGANGYTARYAWGWGIGGENAWPPGVPSHNMNIYVHQVTFWVNPSCAWQTSNCNQTVTLPP